MNTSFKCIEAEKWTLHLEKFEKRNQKSLSLKMNLRFWSQNLFCFDEQPNEETICALENSKLGIGVHKAKNIDDLFVQLKADDE